MKNKILTIVLAIAASIGLIIGGYFVYKSFSPKEDGTITVEVINLDGSIMKSKDIKFNSGDTLEELISSNFDNVEYGTGSNSGMVVQIESYVMPSDYSTFLSIKVNGEFATVGYKDIEFKDKDVISFVITEYDPNYGS